MFIMIFIELQSKTPSILCLAFCLFEEAPGGDLLLHGLSHTTIGAAVFHFRVRDGIGWCHSAFVTRERVEGRRLFSGVCTGMCRLLRRDPHTAAPRSQGGEEE